MAWRPSSGVRWIEVDDGIVVYDGASGRFADLNESAAELWMILSRTDWSEEAVVQHLSSEHGVAGDEARRIVIDFVADLSRTLDPRAR